MGTAEEDFVSLTERIGRKTGGLSVSPFVSARRGAPEAPAGYLLARGKATRDQVPELLALLRDVLLTARLDDRQRFQQMVLETRAALEAGVVGSGHAYAGTRLDAQLTRAGAASEAMGGVAYLEYVRALSRRVERDWEGVAADLERIRGILLAQKGALVNATGDGRVLAATDGPLSDFLASLPAEGRSAATPAPQWSDLPLLAPGNEALLVPTQVSYVCKAANVYAETDYRLSGAAYVVGKFLGTSWLWDRVRVSGGAYGGFCDFDSHSGVFTFSSYRDPNLLKTVDVYDGTAAFLSRLELSPDELTKAVVGTIGDVDAYQLPDAKGRTAFMRHILGITDEERQRRRCGGRVGGCIL